MTNPEQTKLKPPKKPKAPKLPDPFALVRMAELMKLVGFDSRAAVYDKLRTETAFPKPRRDGIHLVWLRSEVVAWIEALPMAKLTGLGAVQSRPAKVPDAGAAT